MTFSTIEVLREGYRTGRCAPREVVTDVKKQAFQTDPSVWIHLLEDSTIQGYLDKLEEKNISDSPLWGMPFAIKDNIDLGDIPTTAACSKYAYTPKHSATVVQRLIDAGAIPIGKTNMDQFATGLVGTRSPYGVVPNAIDSRYIAGGSSSGSAVAVAKQVVPFALGTDTAGSGRIPAAFNGIVGFKPTRGWWSTHGVVPACRTLDCVSVFTNNVADARTVADVVGGFDQDESFSREISFSGFDPNHVRWGYWSASDLDWFGDEAYHNLYQQFIDRLPDTRSEIDPRLFLAAGKMLYEGPWLAERHFALNQVPDVGINDLHPVTRQVLQSAKPQGAVEVFESLYRLGALRREVELIFEDIDVLVVPTAPTHYTLAEVEEEPISTNAVLGTFTNCVNLLDLCGIAIPAGTTSTGMPFGVTLLAQASRDYALLDAAAVILGENDDHSVLQKPGEVQFAVCGAHLSGQPLNYQLTELGAWRVKQTTTSTNYQLYALADGKRPALVRAETHEKGASIEVEIWSLPESSLSRFISQITQPLACGQIELEDGQSVLGFVGGSGSTRKAIDITHFSGWRRYKQWK